MAPVLREARMNDLEQQLARSINAARDIPSKGFDVRPTQSVNEIQEELQCTQTRDARGGARGMSSLLLGQQNTVGCGAEVVMHARYAVHMQLPATRKT